MLGSATKVSMANLSVSTIHWNLGLHYVTWEWSNDGESVSLATKANSKMYFTRLLKPQETTPCEASMFILWPIELQAKTDAPLGHRVSGVRTGLEDWPGDSYAAWGYGQVLETILWLPILIPKLDIPESHSYRYLCSLRKGRHGHITMLTVM